MTSEDNIFSFGDSSDPMQQAREALRAVQHYQQDWQEEGVNRVYKYFDDVEGDWLEEFEPILVNGSAEYKSRVTVSAICEQLRSLGLSTSFIKNMAFPSWWKSELESDEGAISQLLNSLSRRLFLKVNFSQNSDLSLAFLPIPATKFKLQKSQEDPQLFSYLARSIANAVSSTIEQAYFSIPSEALSIRQSILQRESSVNLDSLLDFCWGVGIPVVHFDKQPDGHVKSDGLVVMSGRRPVILIGSSRKQSAWLLFILAHELGHIAKGHLQEGILVDESFLRGVNDDEEDTANQFAAQLLFGDVPLQWAANLNKNRLLAKARCLSEEHNLDSGALILNYGWQTKNWGCAVAALNLLEPTAKAPARINAYYQRHLVSIDEDRRDYLQQVDVLAA
ncbi:MAG: ImmA/IrrE family metallo-endopeptidase [Myxacorys californica WJT36-NPBG1]|jgi:hypothetical protein|nr:ImmA/IrrE family metallo-endopeptidase [Myxacorys californica WJT36-NPBG1]